MNLGFEPSRSVDPIDNQGTVHYEIKPTRWLPKEAGNNPRAPLEKINKSIDGLYFICYECKKICHNLDDGWVEEAGTQNNYCGACAKAKGIRSNAA